MQRIILNNKLSNFLKLSLQYSCKLLKSKITFKKSWALIKEANRLLLLLYKTPWIKESPKYKIKTNPSNLINNSPFSKIKITFSLSKSMNFASKIKSLSNKTLIFNKNSINVKMKSKNPEISPWKFIWTTPPNLPKLKGKTQLLKLLKRKWSKWRVKIKFSWLNLTIKFTIIKIKFLILKKLRKSWLKETDSKKKNLKTSQLLWKMKEEDFRK